MLRIYMIAKVDKEIQMQAFIQIFFAITYYGAELRVNRIICLKNFFLKGNVTFQNIIRIFVCYYFEFFIKC